MWENLDKNDLVRKMQLRKRQHAVIVSILNASSGDSPGSAHTRYAVNLEWYQGSDLWYLEVYTASVAVWFTTMISIVISFAVAIFFWLSVGFWSLTIPQPLSGSNVPLSLLLPLRSDASESCPLRHYQLSSHSRSLIHLTQSRRSPSPFILPQSHPLLSRSHPS
jgi:hypothetical protein